MVFGMEQITSACPVWLVLCASFVLLHLLQATSLPSMATVHGVIEPGLHAYAQNDDDQECHVVPSPVLIVHVCVCSMCVTDHSQVHAVIFTQHRHAGLLIFVAVYVVAQSIVAFVTSFVG